VLAGLLVQKVEAEGAPVQLQVSRVTAEYVHMAKFNDLQVKKQALISSAGFSQVGLGLWIYGPGARVYGGPLCHACKPAIIDWLPALVDSHPRRWIGRWW
jgi:hypothetical protein